MYFLALRKLDVTYRKTLTNLKANINHGASSRNIAAYEAADRIIYIDESGFTQMHRVQRICAHWHQRNWHSGRKTVGLFEANNKIQYC